jgi:hypothetical protein
MKALVFTVLFATLMAMVAGCDTSLEGSYKPYIPGSPAAVLWPSPDAADAQPAGYQEAPTTQPSTRPADSGT